MLLLMLVLPLGRWEVQLPPHLAMQEAWLLRTCWELLWALLLLLLLLLLWGWMW